MIHAIDKNALNDAGWKFVEEHEKRVASQCLPLLFNHIKDILEPVIQHYLLKSGLAEPPEPTFKIGQRFKISGMECLLAQTGPLEVSLIDMEDGNRYNDFTKVSDIHEITVSEMTVISNDTPYEVI